MKTFEFVVAMVEEQGDRAQPHMVVIECEAATFKTAKRMAVDKAKSLFPQAYVYKVQSYTPTYVN